MNAKIEAERLAKQAAALKTETDSGERESAEAKELATAQATSDRTETEEPVSEKLTTTQATSNTTKMEHTASENLAATQLPIEKTGTQQALTEKEKVLVTRETTPANAAAAAPNISTTDILTGATEQPASAANATTNKRSADKANIGQLDDRVSPETPAQKPRVE